MLIHIHEKKLQAVCEFLNLLLAREVNGNNDRNLENIDAKSNGSNLYTITLNKGKHHFARITLTLVTTLYLITNALLANLARALQWNNAVLGWLNFE